MLSTDIRRIGDVAVVAAAGEIDASSARLLRDALVTALSDGTVRMVADLGEVTFMDSSGLGVLVGKLKDVRMLGGELHVVATNDRVLRVFAITGLDGVLCIHGSLDDALASMNGTAPDAE